DPVRGRASGGRGGTGRAVRRDGRRPSARAAPDGSGAAGVLDRAPYARRRGAGSAPHARPRRPRARACRVRPGERKRGGRADPRGRRNGGVMRVDKPWGYELRFATTERYCGKVLFIRAGHQLSLQYHRVKDEAFLVQEGTLELVLGAGADASTTRLNPGEGRRIEPGTGHRCRALTDCRLFAVSTAELDDVVRLQDDYGRVDPL